VKEDKLKPCFCSTHHYYFRRRLCMSGCDDGWSY